MANAFRRYLIIFGKVFPFFMCFVLLIVYVESLVALYSKDYLLLDNSITLNTRISFIIANIFEYDALTVFIAAILSIAIETCTWNRITLVYLTLHLLSRYCIESVELYTEYIYAISIANILICAFLLHKGLTKLKHP